MTAAHRDILKRWIEAGAPFPKSRSATKLTEAALYKAVLDFVLKADVDSQPFLRFFSLAHLANNPAVQDLDLRLTRAALSKAVNSLSRERLPVVPQIVPGTEETVMAVDIRRLGWHRKNLWIEVLKEYPYGLDYEKAQDDPELKQSATTALRLTGGDLPMVRADWFVAHATRPPLYHTLLGIPTKLDELEKQLGVDFKAAFKDSSSASQTLARAGFGRSGVSSQNRLIERIETSTGLYYWISYDFKPRKVKSDLVRFPLGPKFTENDFSRFAFEHDGGEVIFSLPNGMQGYMLVDNLGNRIDIGPPEIVNDISALTGNPAIINGVSCMNCHRQGMIAEFRDEIRQAKAVSGKVQEKVESLYPTSEAMQTLVAQDESRFLAALEKITGPFQKIGDDAGRPIADLAEPVGAVVRSYTRDLGPDELALELGLASGADLISVIRGNPDLQRFGLGTLTQSPPGTIKREKLETRDGTSLLQDIAVQVRRGVSPFNY
jgi:serine/threonine-protein kinase